MKNKVYIVSIHTDRIDRFHKVEDMLSTFGTVERILPSTFILISDEESAYTDTTIIRDSIAGFFFDILIFVSDISNSQIAWRMDTEQNKWLKENL